MGLFGLRPWRCRQCEIRFYARSVPVSCIWYAHCAVCGNFQLQRIERKHVTEGRSVWLRRLLHLPAYRCAHCRRRFFSLRPLRHTETAPSQPVGNERLVPPS